MSIYIIAEAGVNHNGSLENAKKLIEVAKDAGADCIKFQTFVSEALVSMTAQKAEYQVIQANVAETQYEMLKKLELSFCEFSELSRYCFERGIDFLSTAFDFQSIDFLEQLDMKLWKIPSGELTNLPYLIKIARLGKPIIISTGMSTMDEIAAAVSVLKENGSGPITLLHCTTAYPTPFDEVNLRAIRTLAKEFRLPVGYSDHTKGIEVSVAAVALGAIVIEKHFTLDRNMNGPDHQSSIEPKELADLVKSIRNVELALGNPKKSPTRSELKNITAARKSIVAKRAIAQGEAFSEENLTVKRPGNGISPMKWFDIIGQKSPRYFEKDELIEI